MNKEWTDQQYLERAEKEPERLKFWLQYSHTHLEACKSVCENSPQIDRMFRQTFPTPKSLFEFENGFKLDKKTKHELDEKTKTAIKRGFEIVLDKGYSSCIDPKKICSVEPMKNPIKMKVNKKNRIWTLDK